MTTARGSVSPIIPRTLDDVTAEWLTAALLPTRGVTVRDVEIVEVLSGTATKVRLRIDHDGGSSFPTAACLKAGLDDHAAMMAETGIYANEARFFAELRDDIAVPAPRSWWAAVDAAGFGAVLMEDLARPDVRFCRATNPLSVDEVDRALEVHAALHACRFADPWLARSGWLERSFTDPGPSTSYFKTLGPDIIAAELAKPQRGDVVPAELHDPERIVNGFWRWVATNGDGPFCLLHGDAHIGNVYLDHGRPAYCDWQTVRYGRPTLDVAYFVGSALTVEDRRGSERDLLRSYRERLAAAIGDVPSPDAMWLDYRRDMTYGFFAWLTNLDVFQPEEINVATIERFAAAVLDLDSEAAVRGI